MFSLESETDFYQFQAMYCSDFASLNEFLHFSVFSYFHFHYHSVIISELNMSSKAAEYRSKHQSICIKEKYGRTDNQGIFMVNIPEQH